MKLVLISLVLFTGITAGTKNITSIKTVDDLNSAIQKAKKQNKPLILKVFLEHCPACISVKESFEKLAKNFSKKIAFAEINADTPGNGKFMQMFKLSAVPTFILIKKDQLSLTLPEIEKVATKKPGALSLDSLTTVAQRFLAA